METQILNDNCVKLNVVNKIYDMGPVQIKALDNTTLSIPYGKITIILGPSGSGKTTFLNLIGAIDTPTSGNIEVLGHDITKLSRSQLTKFRAEHIGFIFQFFNLIATLTAKENIEYALQINGIRDTEAIVQKVLDQVGLLERANHFPSELSGGEQQRVAIARALAKSPELILADEPTGELDFETGIKILDLLYSLSKTGKTVLIVTHNSEIARIGSRIIRLRSGKIIEDNLNPNQESPSNLKW